MFSQVRFLAPLVLLYCMKQPGWLTVITATSYNRCMFTITSVCKGGQYRYCRTDPLHPRRNAKGLYPLHRVLMENKLGRLLGPDEVVHHKDEDKTNDALENLELHTRAEHARMHTHGREIVNSIGLICRCGQSFMLKPGEFRKRQKRRGSDTIFCSRSCGRRYGMRAK